MIDKTENEIMKHWEISSSIPLVSISCASYNHERYISDALDGFLAQETNFHLKLLWGKIAVQIKLEILFWNIKLNTQI